MTMITSPFDFERGRRFQGGRRIQSEKGAPQFVPLPGKSAADGERVVTFKLPPSWGSVNHEPLTPLTHEEKYGWDPVEARREYGFGGTDGTPAFKGYFG